MTSARLAAVKVRSMLPSRRLVMRCPRLQMRSAM